MYIPAAFAEDDRETLKSLINNNNFGVLLTPDGAGLQATHLPFLLDESDAGLVLTAHMARANPHWKAFANGAPSLAIFQGPHGYVSPSWYAPGDNVPTWNYAAVHCHGTPRVIDDPARVADVQTRLVDAHEGGFETPWRLGDQDPKYLAAMLRGIVAFDMPVDRLEGKAKMSQNKSPADRAGVIDALRESASPADRALADFMAAREDRS